MTVGGRTMSDPFRTLPITYYREDPTVSQTIPTYPSEPTNATRAAWARAALMAFATLTGQTATAAELDDPEHARGWLLEVGGDLLADLFHYADTLGVEAWELVDRGNYHHDAEVAEEAE